MIVSSFLFYDLFVSMFQWFKKRRLKKGNDVKLLKELVRVIKK